jgi:hypothetical protein
MDNFYGKTITEIISVLSSFNINVVQCIREMFYKEQFKKCIGGFFIIFLLIFQLISIFKFIHDGLYNIRKYIFSLTESFNLFMKKIPIINFPPKKRKKTIRRKDSNNKILSSSHLIINKDQLIFGSKRKFRTRSKTSFNEKLITKNNDKDSNEYMRKIKEYLVPNFDERDFEDVVFKDKRKFCQYFCQKYKNDQIFINAFFIHEILRPRALKFLILIKTIEFYFVINALFYNEEYLSILFNSNEEDNFFSFIPRRLNQYIYTSAVSGIISYLMGYFFVDDTKLKRIFLRNKNDEMKMKYELSLLVKNIEKNFHILIFFSIFLSIICFVYISCFNIVYPNIREEWIKSSIFILVLMHILNFLITFLETGIRFLSIRVNSIKLFRLSLWLS